MTRIEAARRKVRVARTAAGVSAAAGLVLFAGLARASHPGTHHTTVANDASAQAELGDSRSFDDDDDSYSYLGPSGSAAPQIQSGAS
ncbi:MAG TPA: hypothetical protein VHC67_04225 [Gaiellaceae bacterium]|nr:hypothetical protein [Gaiellaceae bacterium]